MQQTRQENSIRYYGWAVAASLAITELTSWGILFYSFSVMVTPMRADLGWSASLPDVICSRGSSATDMLPHRGCCQPTFRNYVGLLWGVSVRERDVSYRFDRTEQEVDGESLQNPRRESRSWESRS
jgi:hypothetical protein